MRTFVVDFVFQVLTIKVEKRMNEIVNRLNRTKEERFPNLREEREQRDREEREEGKKKQREQVYTASKIIFCRSFVFCIGHLFIMHSWAEASQCQSLLQSLNILYGHTFPKC